MERGALPRQVIGLLVRLSRQPLAFQKPLHIRRLRSDVLKCPQLLRLRRRLLCVPSAESQVGNPQQRDDQREDQQIDLRFDSCRFHAFTRLNDNMCLFHIGESARASNRSALMSIFPGNPLQLPLRKGEKALSPPCEGGVGGGHSHQD
jgi:hypothetical protein